MDEPRNNAAAQDPRQQWLDLVDDYARRYVDDAPTAKIFRELMRSDSNAASRARSEGHLTGSAWLVSRDGLRVLLTHHRKLGRWLQLGGHADGDADLARVALREAEEESGLIALEVEPSIFDLDRHRIPARGEDAEHWHYDVRFVVHARGSEDFAVSEESHALAWRDIGEIANDLQADESLRRMAQRWLARSEASPGSGDAG